MPRNPPSYPRPSTGLHPLSPVADSSPSCATTLTDSDSGDRDTPRCLDLPSTLLSPKQPTHKSSASTRGRRRRCGSTPPAHGVVTPATTTTTTTKRTRAARRGVPPSTLKRVTSESTLEDDDNEEEEEEGERRDSDYCDEEELDDCSDVEVELASSSSSGGDAVGVTAVPAATLLTPLASHVFKSVRLDGQKLNSAPLELSFRLSSAFSTIVLADVEERQAAKSSLTRQKALNLALSTLVATEILYSDGQVPTVYVEDAGVLMPVNNPSVDFFLDEVSNIVKLKIERNFPLSSSHCGRPFRLAFVFGGDHVIATEPFLVMAKEPKAGTTLKPRVPKRPKQVTAERDAALEAIRQSRLAGPASGICCLSVAPGAKLGDRKSVV